MEPEIVIFLWAIAATGLAWLVGKAIISLRVGLEKAESIRIDNDRKRADTDYLLPNRDGALPVPRALIDDKETWRALLAISSQALDVRRLPASVPHTITQTWAPHNITKNDGRAPVVVEPEQIEAAQMDVKDFFQLYEDGALPSNKLLLGFDMETDEAVIVGWEKLYSCLIGGLSQMGKSTLIRNLLAQSALQGGHFVVLDPHFHSGDKSLGASLAPLQSRMMRDVAHDDKTMASALKFVLDTVHRRLSGKDKERSPLVLVVDECTSLLRRGAIADQLIAVLESVAQESAKVGVFAMCIGQNFNAETMPTVARNSFVSMISCKARKTVARVQADNNEFGKMAQTLGIGQIVFMPPVGEMRRIAVPNTTAEHLEHVGSVLNAQKNDSGVWVPTGEKTSSKTSSKQRQALLSDDGADDGVTMADDTEPLIVDANAERVLAMFYSGTDLPDAITTVYGVTKSGGKYQTISRQIQAILRTQRGNQ